MTKKLTKEQIAEKEAKRLRSKIVVCAEAIDAYQKIGTVSGAARTLNLPTRTVGDRIEKYKRLLKTNKIPDDLLVEDLSISKMEEPEHIAPTDEVQYFVLTSAQDGTHIHKGFLENIEAYMKFRNGRIIISGFSYNRSIFEEHSKKVEHGATYAQEIMPYIQENRVTLGDDLIFCSELNILPTAVNPLSDLSTYTGSAWGIIPHPKVHMNSIPTEKDQPTKIIQTTGAITLPNYIQKKAGQKAEHYHEIAAVVVELLPNGKYFIRHIHADDEDGSFQDLTYMVKNGRVRKKEENVLAITWGDIHHEKSDPVINAACWGVGHDPYFKVMIDTLKPEQSFVHDIIDFTPRNHHNIRDPHFMFEMYTKGTDKVETAIGQAAEFLKEITRPWTKTIVVESNHDLALLRWLKYEDYKSDPVNARYFLELQTEVYRALEDQNDKFQVLSWAMRKAVDLTGITFLHEDESYTIANGIECGMHGHLGANGARANPMQFARMGRRSNTAHTHSATIKDGAWICGVSGSLEMGYNKGLSSWSHSHIITYKSGKRAMITQHEDGLWCADALIK